MILNCLLTFFYKSTFSKHSFWTTTTIVSLSLDPGLARLFVGPGFARFGQNCLQRLSADDFSRLRVKGYEVLFEIFFCSYFLIPL